MKSDETDNQWEHAPEGAPEDAEMVEEPSSRQSDNSEPITWNAEEYIHQDKSPLWFVLFSIAVIGLIAVDVFFLKSWTFSALVIVMAVAVVVFSRRPPRTITYALSGSQGLYVGERLHHFDEFKAFGILKDGPHNSIMLIPTKRFAPGVSVYFPDEAGEQIVDLLGQRLPMENLKLDIIDVLVRKLRL